MLCFHSIPFGQSRQMCAFSQAVTTCYLTASSLGSGLLFTVFAHPKPLLWFLAVYMLQISEKKKGKGENGKGRKELNIKQAGLFFAISHSCCFQY